MEEEPTCGKGIAENSVLPAAAWRLAADFVVRKENLESRIFPLERLSSKASKYRLSESS